MPLLVIHRLNMNIGGLFMVILLVLSRIIHVISTSDPCHLGWSYFEFYDLCYKVSTDKKSWADARIICEDFYGGELTSVKDKETNDFLHELKTYSWDGEARE